MKFGSRMLTRREAACAGLQPQRRVVRGTDQEWPGLGAVQLHHPCQQLGETQLVPWTRVTQRCRVPAQFGHQRKFSGPREREQPRPEVHFSAVRGESLPLQD